MLRSSAESGMRTAGALLAIVMISCAAAAPPPVAPEFTHLATADWINSRPQSLAALRGRVVLIEFWTFGCSNCRNTLPWLQAAHARFARDGLVIVAVHTPEFASERDPLEVREAVDRLGIRYPVMIDNDASYWNALGNRYWPAFYLVGRDGRIVTTAIGELHRGEKRGDRMERAIENLLSKAERGPKNTHRRG
jgi:thiol-disulfide isomerase/thioredoxin